MRITDLDAAILQRLGEVDSTATELGEYFGIEDLLYGTTQAISRRIQRLRRWGLVSDVARRCPTCNCALTRSTRNVKLSLTDAGIEYVLSTSYRSGTDRAVE